MKPPNFAKRMLSADLKKLGVKTAKYFGLITYLQPEQFTPYLDGEDCKYAYILHDKDEAEPHYHIAVNFRYPKSPAFIGELPQDQNTRIKNVQDFGALIAYLTHSNKPHKHQYSIDEVVTNDERYFKPHERKQDQKPTNDEFLADLLTNNNNYDMACKYGRDFIKNYQRYQAFKELLLFEQKQLEKAHAQQELYEAFDELDYTQVEEMLEYTPDELSTTLLHKHFYHKGELLMSYAHIIGKVFTAENHCIYNAVIDCKNGEGKQGITFYGNNKLNIGDEVAVRPYLRKKDNKWIYLLSLNYKRGEN